MSINRGGRGQMSVNVETKSVVQEKIYKGHMVLKYKITYPQFSASMFGRVLKNINNYYELQARKFALHCEKKLYKMAVEQFEYSTKNRLPIQVFEAQDLYELSYNKNCTISLYFDRYEYLGGAHGNTVRRSDTYNLNTGGQSDIVNFFPKLRGVREHMLQEIIRQTEGRIESGEASFYDEYEQDIRAQLELRNFYLIDRGVVIYFQSYDIAPYSEGIPEFLFPFSNGRTIAPSCSRGRR